MALFSDWNVLLRRLRERLPDRKSQSAVGAIVGVSGKMISAYERGETEPQVMLFGAMLELYGVRSLVDLAREFREMKAEDARRRGEPEPPELGLPAMVVAESVSPYGGSTDEARIIKALLAQMAELESAQKGKKGV